MDVCPGLTPRVLGEVWTGSGLASQERLSSILATPLPTVGLGTCLRLERLSWSQPHYTLAV